MTALVLAVALGTAPEAPPAHPALQRGLWIQVTPLDVSFSSPAADSGFSLLPWAPLILGADIGALQLGVGFGVRPLVRDVMIIANPTARLQVPLPQPRLAVDLEVRVDAGLLPSSGVRGGVGALIGLEVFAADWLSLSPGLGVDVTTGVGGGSFGTVVVSASVRMGVNFGW